LNVYIIHESSRRECAKMRKDTKTGKERGKKIKDG
jgi:hypothetical protein